MANSPVAPVLSVRDLRVTHQGQTQATAAVRGIQLDVSAGEIVSVIGESGSGKSTLAAAVLGLLPETAHVEGSINLLGNELVGLNERTFRQLRGSRVALVPQDPGASLNPLLTIGRQLKEVFAIHESGRNRVDHRRRAIELLDQVGIDRPEQRLKQYPHQLSGGQKQRVLIAIGFALQPQLLIADEPTSALDVTVQKRILRVFDELAEVTQTAVLFITHDIAVATDHSSRALVMKQGQIVEDKTIEQIVIAPQSDYTRLLLNVADQVGEVTSTPLAANTGHAVELRGVTKTYRSSRKEPVVAVDDVSFDVKQGSTLALVGESGSGKTTTARALLGLVEPDAGQIDVAGVRVDPSKKTRQRELWRHIQYVHQNPWLAMDPRSTVRSVLSEPLRGLTDQPRQLWTQQIEEVLSKVSLPADVIDRRPHELSGGQRQRVVIARAVLSGAKILVLDEALSALDVVTQQQIVDLLGELQRTLGLTYIFILHDLSVVQAIAHEVAVLRRGELVEFGSTHEVFNNPSHEYTRELIAAIPGKRIAALRSAGRHVGASAPN